MQPCQCSYWGATLPQERKNWVPTFRGGGFSGSETFWLRSGGEIVRWK